MSGVEIAGLVLAVIAVFPTVAAAIRTYREALTKSSSKTAISLSLKVQTGAVVFDQSVRRLLSLVLPEATVAKLIDEDPSNPTLWETADVDGKLLAKLGPKRAKLLEGTLDEMRQLLKGLQVKLDNINKGTEVLDKIKSSVRAARANNPNSSLRKDLKQVSELNFSISQLLSEGQEYLSYSKPAVVVRFPHRDQQEPIALYKAMCQGYACNCDEPHLANLGCHCHSCSMPFAPMAPGDGAWTFQLVFLPTEVDAFEVASRITASARSTAGDEVNKVNNHDNAVAEESRQPMSPDALIPPPLESQRRRSSISTRIDLHQHGKPGDEPFNPCLYSGLDESERKGGILGILGDKSKCYRLSIQEPADPAVEGADPIPLEDFIGLKGPRKGPALTSKERISLGFQLCLLVLQLSVTPWIDDSWTWEDCRVLTVLAEQKAQPNQDDDRFFSVEDQIEVHQLFVAKKFYSSQLPVAQTSLSPRRSYSALSMLGGSPILVKLGFALIVLALGKTLRELREETPSMQASCSGIGNEDVRDLMTARHLLKTNHVRDQVGCVYSNVVAACIEPSDDMIRSLESRDNAFFDRAEKTIMAPLYNYYTTLFQQS